MNTASQKARVAIIVYSLCITAFLLVVLTLAQPLGFRFDYGQEQNLRLIDIVLPTFFGYLGSASHFIFNTNSGSEVSVKNESMLRILIHGPFIVFILSVASLFFAHYHSHASVIDDRARIDALDFNTMSRYLSINLAMLAATTSIVSSYLFGSPPRPDGATPQA